jgi:hypothetical protein
MINNDYLVWFSAGWMKWNMCASCRIPLHDPIVFRNLFWLGNMPITLRGCASLRVYVRGTADGWILLRSYLGFCYAGTDSNETIFDTLIIEVVDIPCRNSPYYVAYTRTWILEPSVYLSGCKIEWRAYVCRRLLQRLACSESHHFNRDKDPTITMAYGSTGEFWKIYKFLWNTFSVSWML